MHTTKVEQLTIEERRDQAREQSAIFPTRLALARWMSGDEPVSHFSHPPLRAAWLAKAQRDFQAWLDGGGFVQHDDGELDSSWKSGNGKPSWAV
jgi:hypothetical protein